MRYFGEEQRLNLWPTYPLQEAADLLGVEAAELDRAVLNSDLDASRLGDTLHVTVSSLDRYAESHSTPSRPARGGDWESVPEAVRQALWEEHVETVERVLASDREQLQVARARLAELNVARLAHVSMSALEPPAEAVRLYSVAAAAKVLDVSDDYVYARIKDGSLRAVELGDSRAKLRVRADDLQAFIDVRTFGGETP
ncbi:hypothetical protein DCE94_03740 [Agromyces badenianii]|nr:hypothetical protein DCE94_03740 [Agromyces badenianii]